MIFEFRALCRFRGMMAFGFHLDQLHAGERIGLDQDAPTDFHNGRSSTRLAQIVEGVAGDSVRGAKFSDGKGRLYA
jgi:hypothetical protein